MAGSHEKDLYHLTPSRKTIWMSWESNPGEQAPQAHAQFITPGPLGHYCITYFNEGGGKLEVERAQFFRARAELLSIEPGRARAYGFLPSSRFRA